MESRLTVLEGLNSKLQKDNELLTSYFDTAKNVIFRLDIDYNVIGVNYSLEDYFGVKREEVLNRPISSFHERIKGNFENPDQYMEYVTHSTYARHSNGSLNILELSRSGISLLKPKEMRLALLPKEIFNVDGKLVGRMLTYVDITELAKTTDLIQTVVEASPVPTIVSKIEDGKIVFVNKPLAELFDLTTDEILDNVTPDFYADPRDRDDVVRRLKRDGFLKDYEVRLRKPSGELLWMIFNFTTAVLAGEDVIIGTFYEISERKKAEEKIRRSEELFRQLTDNIGELFWMTTPDKGELIYVSKMYREIFNRDEADIYRQPEIWLDYVHEDDREAVVRAMPKQITGEFAEEYRITRPDGTVRWVSENAYPIKDENGDVYRICGVVEDITDRKNAENALRWERNFVSAVLDTAGAQVVVLDPEGRIIRFNRACERLSGYSFDEVKNKPFWDILLLPEEVDLVKERFKRLYKGEFPNSGENYWVSRSGEKRLIAWSNTTLEDVNGTVEYVISIGIDITEARAAEEKHQLYHKVFMESSDSIVITSPEGKIMDWNPSYKKATGLSDEELRSLSPSVSHNEVREAILNTGRFEGEILIQNPGCKDCDAGKVHVDLSVFPIMDDNGELSCYVGIGRDITERKRYEEKLKLYKQIFMDCSDGIVINDAHGNLVEINPAYKSYSGYTEEQLIENGGHNFIHEGDHEKVHTAIAKTNYFRGEVRTNRVDGIQMHIDLSLFPIFSDSGELVYYVGMGRDVTQRKKDEEIIATRLRYEEGLAACSQELLVTGDLDETINQALYYLRKAIDADRIYIFENFEDPEDGLCMRNRWEVCAKGVKPDLDNPVLQHLPYRGNLGPWKEALSNDQAFGGPVSNLAPDVQALLRDAGTLSILAQPIWVNDVWWGFIGLDNTHEEHEWSEEEIRLLRTSAGMIGGYITRRQAVEALRVSLTDLEKANRHLRETQTQLVQSEKMASLGMLVAGIAHEINTPIGAVNSMHNTSVRAMQKLREAMRDYCNAECLDNDKIKKTLSVIDEANRVIESGTERVTTIVRRLRSFARLDEAELKEADIHEGFEDTLTLIHHEIKHNITVNKNYGDLPKIACFPGRLNQVFLNILINTKQAITDKGEISITTYVKEEKVYIEISDNGVGIPPDKIHKIFDPGFTTKGVGVGTGLGLSICYQIIQDHHGEIRVESEVGVGTTFTIILPMNLDELLAEK